jgi:hypothetical protein
MGPQASRSSLTWPQTRRDIEAKKVELVEAKKVLGQNQQYQVRELSVTSVQHLS